VLLAHLFLAITTVAERVKPTPTGLIPLTLNEIRHLFTRLVIGHTDDITACLHWSWRRRRHQYRAQQVTTSANRPRNHEHHDLRLEY
jgi:hypothetical protein